MSTPRLNRPVASAALSPRVARMALTRSGIRIGIRNVPRQRIEHTPDSDRLQAALLAKPRDPDPWVIAGGSAVLLALLAMALADWLPPGVGA